MGKIDKELKKKFKRLLTVNNKRKSLQYKPETELYYNVTASILDKFESNPYTVDGAYLNRLFSAHDTDKDNLLDSARINDRLYTLIEEDGDQFIVRGNRYVNRLGYLILKES